MFKNDRSMCSFYEQNRRAKPTKAVYYNHNNYFVVNHFVNSDSKKVEIPCQRNTMHCLTKTTPKPLPKKHFIVILH